MTRCFSRLCVAAVVCGAAASLPAFSQGKVDAGKTQPEKLQPGKIQAGKTWNVPPPSSSSQPFSVNVHHSHAVRAIEFLPQDRISAQDKLMVADAESSVAQRAHWSGISLQDGSWSYRQVLCPSFPGHLFLRYTRNNGARDVTVFSVSIPRDGQRVRIIPILKRSYSLFAPAPINALTISAFNHIRAEEHGADNARWLEDGLCYAALAGANPVVESPYTQPKLGKPVPAVSAVLTAMQNGGEVMRFADAAGGTKPVEWVLTFSRKGRLVKVAHGPAPLRAVQPVPAKSAVAKAWTVPGSSSN
ncbi:MAG TPA: hypothetical protein VFU55_11835 [Terracidiphilus sp.]|nr:hypothetical protein [Terracidiphilus sp.]